MKIFASIVAFLITAFVGINMNGLLGGTLASDLDLLNFGAAGVIVVLIALLSNENKELRKEIKEIKTKLDEFLTTEKNED